MSALPDWVQALELTDEQRAAKDAALARIAAEDVMMKDPATAACRLAERLGVESAVRWAAEVLVELDGMTS